MNNVNKDNAIGLKEIGFDVPVLCYYNYESYDTEIYAVHYFSENHNLDDRLYSAPDFLTAADWFYKKRGIYISLNPESTSISEDGMIAEVISTPDHRNAAIAAAIKMVKEKLKQK